jgi:hypothetical protein
MQQTTGIIPLDFGGIVGREYKRLKINGGQIADNQEIWILQQLNSDRFL